MIEAAASRAPPRPTHGAPHRSARTEGIGVLSQVAPARSPLSGDPEQTAPAITQGRRSPSTLATRQSSPSQTPNCELGILILFESHDGRRGHTGQLYEGGVRVPFLASWPGHFPEGHVSDRLVSTVDVTATVLDLAGLAPATDPRVAGDSVSFAAAAQGAPPGSLAARPHL